MHPLYSGIREIRTRLATHGYEATEQTARAVCMADRTGRALLVEGGTGVGKTELARALALGADATLIRLQCYEGIGEQEALYAWNHAKQILRLQSSAGVPTADVFAEEFLLERPLLAAIRSTKPTVLLIDEVDKAQIEFDALLLEVLSDFSVTIGEYGTITTTRRPLVVLTSGGKRDLSDALRRRCHFLHLPSPSSQMERRILDHRVPDAEHRIERGLNSIAAGKRRDREWIDVVASIGNSEALLGYVVQFVDTLRESGVPCGPSSLIDAVDALGWVDIADREQVREALCCTMVHREVELPTFYALFDLWFPETMHRGEAPPAEPLDTEHDAAERVAATLAGLDQAAADSDAALNSLAAELVSQFGTYQRGGTESYSALQAVRAFNPTEATSRVALSIAAGMPASPFNSTIAERTAASRVESLRRAVTLETNRRVAQQRGREAVAAYAVPRITRVDETLDIDTSELAAVRRAVVELGRVLASRQASQRRRARAGEIDMRRTMRKSMSTGGVPITLARRRPRLSKPELVVLCDMSSSVSEWSYFTLILVDALRKAFSRVRIFAFIDRIDDVTNFFKPGTDLSAAVARLHSEANIDVEGRSDYGAALAGFVVDYPNSVTSKTSLLVIGDARGNYRAPRSDVIRDLADTALHAHWLNPEPERIWGSGDSAADTYSKDITMHECRNAGQLSAVITALIDV